MQDSTPPIVTKKQPSGAKKRHAEQGRPQPRKGIVFDQAAVDVKGLHGVQAQAEHSDSPTHRKKARQLLARTGQPRRRSPLGFATGPLLTESERRRAEQLGR